MPEGDSVHRLARRLDAALTGHRLATADLRVPRHATADLRGARVTGTVARGKHLLTRLEVPGHGRLTLHTHLRMSGSWTVLRPGSRPPRRLEHAVRALLTAEGGRTAMGLDLPVVELLRTDDEAQAVGHLGPDLLDPSWGPDHEAVALARLAAQPDRPLVEALLDQRLVAGLGNLWAVEACFLRGRSPWTRLGEEDLPALVGLGRRLLAHGLAHPGMVTTGDARPGRTHWVYGRAGRPCRRCGTPVRFAPDVPLAPYARETWWCPRCQPGPERGG